MLKNLLVNDFIAKYLFERSSFTNAQLDTLLISLFEDPLLTIEKKAALRDTQKVTIGSFTRTLKQSKINLEKTLYTVIISEYLSIFSKKNFSNLIRIGELLSELNNINSNKDKITEILYQISYNISSICHNM